MLPSLSCQHHRHLHRLRVRVEEGWEGNIAAARLNCHFTDSGKKEREVCRLVHQLPSVH